MFLNSLVIVWRESLEALLIVGILLAWSGTQAAAPALRRSVWVGVAGGVALSLAVALLAVFAQQALSGDALDLFQTALLFATCALIAQMVLWMHRHGSGMRRELEARAAGSGDRWGLALVATMAVAREGIETVLFLFGAFVQAGPADLPALLGGMLTGFGAAVACTGVAVGGARRIPLRTLFRLSEAALLVVANAMLANGIDRVLGRDWLPQLADLAWDSGALLDDTQGLGQVLADFAGYRAQPSLLLLAAYLLFWSFLAWRMLAPRRAA